MNTEVNWHESIYIIIKEILNMYKNEKSNCLSYVIIAIVCLVGTLLISSSQAQEFIWKMIE